MNKLVHGYAVIAVIAGVYATGCGEAGPASSQEEGSLTEGETAALLEETARNTVAEISVPQGKMRFIETEPGAMLIIRDFPIGAKIETLPHENEMTVEEIYRGYSNEPVPPALAAALDRMKAGIPSSADEDVSRPAQSSAASRQPRSSATHAEGAAVTRLSLASTIDLNWFKANFCGYSGSTFDWCHPVAFTGARAWGKVHRGRTTVCGDTGAARLLFKVSGADHALIEIPYGQCRAHTYHGPHDFLGSALTRTLDFVVDWAQQSVRFSGWFTSGDQFVVVP